jgi:photosystem II stability/assembly factor-like uncharacterized protein
MLKPGKSSRKQSAHGKKGRRLEELPERFELWKKWNLMAWGGKLPGREAILAANSHRLNMVHTVEDIPKRSTDILEHDNNLYGSSRCLYGEKSLPVERVKNPNPKGSFGFASDTVQVHVQKPLIGSAELIIPLRNDAEHNLVRYSIRLFHWQNESKSFRLVPMSGIEREGKAAWGRIHEGGVYVAIGYPRDPIVRHTIKLMRLLRSYRRGTAAIGTDGAMRKRICELILCQGDLWDIPIEEAENGTLILPEDFGPDNHLPKGKRKSEPSRISPGRSRYLRNICDICLGLPGGDFDLPEGELEPGLGQLPGGSIESPSCRQWTSIGPANITCVIRAIAAHPTDLNILYAAAEFGGIWKTTNGGAHWTPTMDRELNLHSDAIGLCRSHPNVLYAGMSDGNRGANIDMYRSNDGGASWVRKTELPSSYSHAISIHPNDANILYLAGDLSLHKSEDGGSTWQTRNVTLDGTSKANLHGIFDGDIDDVKIDPDNPNTVYISVRSQGLFKTTDGGSTWRRIATGFTFDVLDDDGVVQTVSANGSFRTLLDIGEDDGPGKNGTNFIAAKIQGTILTSPDGGSSWRVLPGANHGHDSQNHWTSCVAICPSDQDFIVAGGDHIDFTLNASDTSPTWNALPTSLHCDQQSIAFTASNPSDFYFANDGFIGRAINRGSSVNKVSDGLVANQCFNVAVSQTSKLVVGCSTYHTGTIRTGQATFTVWEWIDGPEGGLFEIDPTDEKVFFDSPWGASLRKSIDGGGTWVSLSGMIDVGGAGREAYITIIGIRPDDSRKIYASGFYGRLHYTTDGGSSWDFVKYPDKSPLLIDGGSDQYDGASSMAYAPSNGACLYIGTIHGRLWRTSTAATMAGGWEELNPPVSPVSSNFPLSAIAVHPTNPDKIYVGYLATITRPVWRGERQGDGTFRWDDISGLYNSTSLPPFPVSSLIIDHENPQRIFAATKVGVFMTEDEGDWWRPFNDGLPNVSIEAMRLRRRSRTLYAAAYGRGIFKREI